jgi:membrane protein YdbS with pleckstrin-like domain
MYASLRLIFFTGAAAILELSPLGGRLFRGELSAVEDGVRDAARVAFPLWSVTASVAGFFLILAIVLPQLYYRRWRYALREHDLWIRQGLIFHRVSVIPYRRLQFVDTRQGPLERWMGLTELVVHTAAPGTSGQVPGLEEAEAMRIREALAAFEVGDGDVDGR